MPIPQVQFTPMRAPRGTRVHVGHLLGGAEGRTACNKPCQGWVVALSKASVDCQKCKNAVYLRVVGPGRGRRRQKVGVR